MQAELHAKAQVCLLLALEFYAECKEAPIEIRSPTYLRDMCGSNGLQPDWLPDPRCAVIPDPMGLLQPVLLTTRLRQVLRHIFGADDKNLVFTWAQGGCDVGAEGSLPTFMGCNKLCVDPYRCPVVYCTTVQEKPLP